MGEPTAQQQASEALLDDVVTMTRQAAVDGLTLAAVFDDLRLVLDLGPREDVPADVLRTCAVAWAETHQELSATGDRGVAFGTLEDLEGNLWSLLADPSTEVPDVALVVAPTRPDVVLRDADVLLVAARDLQTVFDRAGEQVVLVGSPGSPVPSRVVVLARYDGDRVALARTKLQALATTVHRLGDEPDGTLTALRRALGEH